MRSSSTGKLLVALGAMGLYLHDCYADTMYLRDSAVSGKLIKMTDKSITFAPGCGGEQVYDATQMQRIVFNASCNPTPFRPYSAGGETCRQPRPLYDVVLKNPAAEFAASQISAMRGRIDIVAADGASMAHGPLDRVDQITKRLMCPDELSAIASTAGFCIEPKQWAAHFSYDPVFGNRILTQGVSFYLEDDDGAPIPVDDPHSEVVRASFRTALMRWMSALFDKSKTLPPALHDPLEKMASHSQHGYVLFTPPQVIQLGCKDTATFIVRYITKTDALLRVPGNGHPKAARAQVAGRTIFVNGADYKCWKSDYKTVIYLNPPNAPGGDCLNLVPILTHELGHAFGLVGHHDDISHPSIMDSVIQDSQAIPSPADIDDLAAIMMQPLEGTAPGRLDADGLGVEIKPRTPSSDRTIH